MQGEIEPFTLVLPDPLRDILDHLLSEEQRRTGDDVDVIRDRQREALIEGARCVVVRMLEGL